MSEILLTSRELARRLNCSERKLERHRLVGDGPPYIKFGGTVRYPPNELEQWLADNTRRSTSEAAALTGRKPRRKARAELELNALK